MVEKTIKPGRYLQQQVISFQANRPKDDGQGYRTAARYARW